MSRVTILGAGGWGTALAVHLARDRGEEINLWVRRPELARQMHERRENHYYLPGVELPPKLRPEADLATVLDGCRAVILAVPSHGVREMAKALSSLDVSLPPILSVAKGMEEGTTLRPSQVLEEELGVVRLAVLSGPNHAEEVGRGLPAATVLAAADDDTAALFQELLHTTSFRVYTSRDVAGVELGGSLKNVIALAVGIADGLNLGDNAQAALVTRGLAEMCRLGERQGARPETFAGLSGLGDLVVTCGSSHSRNFRTGQEIGRGRPLDEILAGTRMAVEGVRTTRSARQLAQQVGVELPVTEAVHRVLFEGEQPAGQVARLMERQPRDE